MSSPPEAPPPVWQPAARNLLSQALIVVLAAGLIALVLWLWRLPPFERGEVATDNAYVRGRVAVIAPQVSGYVAQVAARDYAKVAAGAVLVRVDDRIYRARLAQAQAQLDAQRAALANNSATRAARSAGWRGQQAALANADAQLARARADMQRAEELVKDGSISARERDQTLAALRQAEAAQRQARAGSDVAREDLRMAEVGRAGLEAQVRAAQAQLELAQIDLNNTVIRAPEAGHLGEIGVRLGQYVSNGTQLLSLVPADPWVIAHFKEAQTADIAPGQRAEIRVDALGGALLYGTVQQLAPAAAGELALLKPEHGNGNFVKIPQRIGVRIVFDRGQALLPRLRPGMSVEARVLTRGQS